MRRVNLLETKDAAPFTVARYTGQESTTEKQEIANNPPDILLTNFMMLELILTRFEKDDREVVDHCLGLEFLVLDELHTYRGRQGADVALLVRRLRERLKADQLVCIGTSATMSSTGTQSDRNQTVASVASLLFGTSITDGDVIGETLERVTNRDKNVEAIKPLLKASLVKELHSWVNFEEFKNDPLAIWVELILGIELPADEPPRRAKPITLKDAASRLTVDAQCTPEQALNGLQRFLIAANDIKTAHHRAPFAFKLHQFISGPGKVLATLEPAGKRHITLDAQRFAPGRQEEEALLYPVHFCRECGQEYHPVWYSRKAAKTYTPREINDISGDADDNDRYGFLCPSNQLKSYTGSVEDLPESWLDLSKSEPKVKSTFKHHVPELVRVSPQGKPGQPGTGEAYWYIPGKFRFCLGCGQAHEVHGKDNNRLASLSGEGRSSATTILTLSALRQLFEVKDIRSDQPDPRKILGFTDNRQDAALQAGHFNDFVFLLTLRSALIGALQNNQGVLTEETLSDAVFKSLGFDKVDLGTLAEYLRNPKPMGQGHQVAQRTLRFIIGYRLLRDLRRGWRFNNPNLDQLNLLSIAYQGIDDFSADSSLFNDSTVLSKVTPSQRAELVKIVFDSMRRSLCLETRYLNTVEQEQARNTAHQHLNERWAFATDEKLETSRYLILTKRPEYKGKKPRIDLVPGGSRTRLLKDLKKATVWNDGSLAQLTQGWKDAQWVELLEQLLQAASNYGYVQKFDVDNQVIGWRLNASSMEWRLVPEHKAKEDGKHNRFFRILYRFVAQALSQPGHALFDLEAQEHTAQVDAPRRQLLEQRFRYTEKDCDDWIQNPVHDAPLKRLPVMFCSPTMELGVDISALNTVYLRNVPPTPANYAQRSGRAGRSGQQALVITYCAALSPHDQWFFHHATEMVHGIVRPPTLDLANRDLIESHLHAVWLAAAQQQLETSIAPLLDLEQDGKPLKPALRDSLFATEVTSRALQSAKGFVAQLGSVLNNSPWFTADHVVTTIERVEKDFNATFDRWRALVDATRKQMDMANQVVTSYTTSHAEKQNAQRRYGDAARQYDLLLKPGNGQYSDFYTYRYLASQGFLPGYNFPRLPLMAWIPAKGGNDGEGSMVSRPRFLALSEFGPRSLIYHQGRMYRVVRAKLNVGSADHISGNSTLATVASRVCSQCGYAHMGDNDGSEPHQNCCENCGSLLTEQDWVKNLYRIETVETIPVERISINDEDRQRQGFELQTTYRFLPGPNGTIAQQKSNIRSGSNSGNDSPALAALTYSPAAQIWRINRGWRRRKDKEQLGFYINPITGQWSKKDEPGATEDDNTEAGLLDKVPNQQIVPYVEDHRNILILAPATVLDSEAMATLQAALKRGIEMTFQIEEAELVAEPLPKEDERRALLFYEAAEGGAGVLTRLATEPQAMAQVAAAALRVMHYRAPDGPWTVDGLPALEEKNAAGYSKCEAGCYQCLLSYFNQPDHEHINRRNPQVIEMLVALANSHVTSVTTITEQTSPSTPVTVSPTHGDDLFAKWKKTLLEGAFMPPDQYQVRALGDSITLAGLYKSIRAAVLLAKPTLAQAAALQDKGYTVVDMSDPTQWSIQFAQYPRIFGGMN